MRLHAVAPFLRSPAPMTRRSFLLAAGLASVSSLRPLAAGFTAIADEPAALMRWCVCDPAPRFAAGNLALKFACCFAHQSDKEIIMKTIITIRERIAVRAMWRMQWGWSP